MTTNLPNFSANKYKFPIIGYTFEVAGRTEYSSTLLNESQRALIREQMSTWEAISAASFVEVPNSLPVGLYIGIDTISDGPNGVLASVTDRFYPTAFDTGLLETDINPPEYKSFRIDPADINSSIISSTILHEIGHVLGLSHRTDVESIMGPFVGQGLARDTIQQADIDLVQRLYGLPDEEDVAGEFSSAKNITVNSTTTGFHHAGDELDIYSVTLRQNKEYTIDLKGASTGSGTMSNPYMELFQEPASGSNNLQYITFGLLGGVGGDDQITYTPSTSGTFYIYSKSVNSPLFNNGETGSYTLSITTPNTAPVALNDAASATAGQAVTINIGANDSDADGDNLTTTGVTGPTKGTVRYTDNLSSADTVRYTPFSTATGTDSFTYQVSDGNGGTDTARVTITISAPDQSADTSTTGRISVGESVTGELSLSPFDPDDWFAIRLLASKNYIFNLEGSPTGKGTATDTFLGLYGPTGNFIQQNDNSGVGLNARLSYTPQETGTYYIAARYTNLNDGDFGEGTGGGTYTLSAALNNRSPVAGNDTATATAGQSVTINIGANDSDPDRDNLTTTGLTDPAKGTVRYTDNFTTSDTVTYTPFSTATGTDSFTYQVNDGKDGADTASVTINFIGAANIVTMTRSTDVLISSSPEDILDIDQAAILGGLNIDLGNASDQIITYNGSNNSGSITGFENVLADGYTGSFGSLITGSSNANTITATSNTDVVLGLGGNDIITGGGGNDTLDGGAGTDTAIFSGSKSQYTFRESGKTVIVSDSQTGRDGSDTLSSMENYQFSDGTFQLSDLLNVSDIDRGIYRFFNVDNGTHFLSASTLERDSVINNLDAYNFEGAGFKSADPASVSAEAVFRFFNTETGAHFFTQSTGERDSIIENLPNFNFEGEAYKGYTEQVEGSIPLYRFFNTQTGTHFYTAAEAEKDSIIENLPSFNFEGTAYWVDPVMG